jgi:NAD-dependent deacetylase
VCIDAARQWIKDANAIAVLTGAGISAESGIPTFRGTGGLWKNFRPEELATPQAFAHDRKLVWEWYDWRRSLIQKAEPNAGHLSLVELERRSPRFTLVTQNVDGLHRRAGSLNVLEVHGSIWALRCTRCGREWHDETVPLISEPRCACGALARPGVVWFGEALPSCVWAAAEQAAGRCDVLLVVGTSAVVYPAAGLIDSARSSSGAKIVEVNTERTGVSDAVDCSLIGRAGEILPQLLTTTA